MIPLRRSLCLLTGLAAACGLGAASAASLQLQHRYDAPLPSAKRSDTASALLVARYADLDPASLQRSSASGRIERYRQDVNGIDVFGARLVVLRDANRTPQLVGGSYSTKTASAALPAFALSAPQALNGALAQLGLDTAVGKASTSPRGDDYTRFDLSRSASVEPLQPARAKPVWFPAEDRLIAAYYAEVLLRRSDLGRPSAYALVVSAEDGRVLRSNSQIHDVEAFTYRAFAGADGFPYVDAYGHSNPHPTGLRDGYRPVVPAPMSLVTLSHAGSGDPWLADDATETRGNNVDAYFAAETLVDGECYGDEQMAFDATVGDFRARTNGPRRFDYAYDANATLTDYLQCNDPGQPIPVSDAQLNAKIVQGFYAANWLHDYFYTLGYDEAAGNSQADNYGRGGIAGDPMLIQAAQFATYTYAPADGESPALILGFNSQSRSRRDVSAFDFGVLAHEWAHTMFGRLTVSGYYGQPGAINEGTADYVGLVLSVREQDRHAMPGRPAFSGAYAVGAYMNLDYDFRADDLPQAGSPGHPDNSYYQGIRRFPYSSERQRNPLTFRHIGIENPVPAASQPFDWKARSLVNAEIHTAGEIWTTALWQCTRNVLAAAPSAQFEARRRDVLRWLVTGLTLFPVDATYTEARNALLAAIRVDSDADYRRCRSGFAERGMGAGAVSPPRHSFSLRDSVESFRDTEYALSIVDVELREDSGDGDGFLDRGETGRVFVTLRNSGFSALDRITLAVPPIPGLFTLPERVYVEDLALAPEETREIALPLRIVAARGPLAVPVQVFAWDSERPAALALTSRSFDANLDLRRDRVVDGIAHRATFVHDWQRGFEEYPHGCALYICLGASGDELADVLDWQRERFDGRLSYVMGDGQLGVNAWLATPPFTASATTPLEFALSHRYDFERATTTPGYGRLEVRLDDGDWQPAAPLLASGSADFAGQSAGWRDDSVRFTSAVAGRRVQLRLRMSVAGTFRANDVHWAISRAEVRGASDAVFSRVVADF